MSKWIEWCEPWGVDGNLSIIVRAKPEDVIKFRREVESRYETDQDAIDDFMTVYWAVEKEYDDAPSNS